MSSRPAPTRLARSIAVISLVLAGRADAQTDVAEAMFNEGNQLMAAGKVAEACAAFEASNNLDPRAGTLIRLGECLERSNQLASAVAAYKAGLARAKDPYKREIATVRLTKLEPRLSRLTIVVGANKVAGLSVTRDGKPVDPTTWDRALPVDGGSYVIAATAPDFDDWQVTITVPAENGDVTAVLQPLRTKAVALRQPVLQDPSYAEQAGLRPRRKIALGVAGFGAAGLIGGAVLGIVAKGRRDDAFKLCPDPGRPCADAASADSLTSSGHRLAIAADIGFGIAVAGAIAAGVLWFTDEPQPGTRTAILPTANGLAVMGRF
jgi:hypothetical protein